MYPITIILPVYNGIQYLEQCVNSVLSQSFANFQFLIIDDCSTDKSWEYLQSLKDSRVILFRNEKNKGLFYNLNFLIKKNGSSLIKLWSQDDVMYNNCIEEVIKFHQLHTNIGFSYTSKDYIDGNGNPIVIKKIDNTPVIVNRDLHTRIAFITGSITGNIANVTLSKAALDKVGLFNEEMKISGDFEMWVRMAKEFDIGFIKIPLIQLRNHTGQLSGQEKYFIYHLKEDIKVYRYLFSYLTEAQKKVGTRLLRNQKLLFYYTLMLKALLKGKLTVAYTFFKVIAKFDNFFIVTWYYCKHKIFRIKPIFN